MAFEALSGKVGPSIYLLCVCITFVFVVVSTPIAQFKGKGVTVTGAGQKGSCVTFWGLKNDCKTNGYTLRPADMMCEEGNTRLRQVFQAAEAFSIISIFVVLVSGIAVVKQLAGSSTHWIAVLSALLSVATVLIPWACMAAVPHSNMCGEAFKAAWKANWKFSAGFGLFVSGWAIQVIGTACLILLN
ncbi:amastin [Trypanosoma grayi]|uniref:amastin n=1 Tax=Trypanosoma grayi TaxID=71804 RepID=UPI0004F48D63|nr:amastin [Trypanosoma grayi]KEG09347.1 amastin [Trypanosoma grayi]